MSTWRRWLRFNIVGVLGAGVQVMMLTLLVDRLGVDYRLATVVGVAAAVAHNFAWHWQWTWRDRLRGAQLTPAFVRFAASNGIVSTAGNLVLMQLFVGRLGVPTGLASTSAIVICALLNFWSANAGFGGLGHSDKGPVGSGGLLCLCDNAHDGSPESLQYPGWCESVSRDVCRRHVDCGVDRQRAPGSRERSAA